MHGIAEMKQTIIFCAKAHISIRKTFFGLTSNFVLASIFGEHAFSKQVKHAFCLALIN